MKINIKFVQKPHLTRMECQIAIITLKKNIEPNWLKGDLGRKKILQIENKIKKQGKGKDSHCIVDCNYVDKSFEKFYNSLSSSNFVSHNFSL